MASKDFVRKEKKKPKKDAKKAPVTISLEPPRPEVEVIKHGKKNREEEEV